MQFKKILFILAILLFLNSAAMAKPLWVHSTPEDPPLSLTLLQDTTGDGLPELVAGYDSGVIICFSSASKESPKILWMTKIEGSVLAVRPMADSDKDGFPEVAASTDLGVVACISAGGNSAGKIHWTFNGTFNFSQLEIVNDANADGINDVAFGGADHRVHLLSGADGKQLWSRFFESGGDITYVDCISNAGDLNGDQITDLYVRTWMANLWAISGVDGTDIWPPQPGSFFLSTLLTAKDINEDGLNEVLVSGNNGVLQFYNGKDGSELWRCSTGRPIRSIAISEDVSGDGMFDCYAGNASGKVACISGKGSGNVAPLWTADVEDVCRALIALNDIDQDGRPDIAAGAENGIVAAFSGTGGKQLWKWQGPDVVRTMISPGDIDGDGISDLAVALIDGTLALLPGKPDQEFSTLSSSKRPKPKRSQKKRTSLSETVAQVPILLYHDVSPAGLHPSEASPLENFRQQMDFLVEEKFTSVSLDEIADWIEGKGLLPPKPVCITFDGQYASHHSQLIKILKERKLISASYITTDWIGTANHLDWHELRQLERSGHMDIENHSINHPTLTGVSREEVIRQVSGCNEAIAKHLEGKKSTHHAYPNGPNNSTVRQILQELGTRTATAVFARNAIRSDSVLNLPRFTIAEDMNLASFKALMGRADLVFPPLPYKYNGTVGENWNQPSYGDVDAEGKLWICDYSASQVRVFMPDGKEAPFSPISEGQNENGKLISIRAPSGIAVTPSGEVWVSIAYRFDPPPQYYGLFRYQASDGKVLTGKDLSYYPGDLDANKQGLIYVMNKIAEEVHVYTSEGVEIPGSPFGKDSGFHIQRGLSVTPDGSKVYVISDTARRVNIWEGSADATSVNYKKTGMLVDQLTPQSSGVDVMDDGTVFVSYHEEGMVVAFDAQHQVLGQISGGGVPSLGGPRGVAFTPDGKTLWVIGRFGQVQRWDKIEAGK